jgi:hypothetical protein
MPRPRTTSAKGLRWTFCLPLLPLDRRLEPFSENRVLFGTSTHISNKAANVWIELATFSRHSTTQVHECGGACICVRARARAIEAMFCHTQPTYHGSPAWSDCSPKQAFWFSFLSVYFNVLVQRMPGRLSSRKRTATARYIPRRQQGKRHKT